MPSAAIDPAVTTFLSRLCDGAGSLPDSIAALIFRLAARVTRLEQTTSAQADKIKKLEKQPRRSSDSRIVATGVDVEGNPVRIEERVRRPVGRPKGRRDTHRRQRRGPREVQPEHPDHHPPPEIGLLDPEWDS